MDGNIGSEEEDDDDDDDDVPLVDDNSLAVDIEYYHSDCPCTSHNLYIQKYHRCDGTHIGRQCTDTE